MRKRHERACSAQPESLKPAGSKDSPVRNERIQHALLALDHGDRLILETRVLKKGHWSTNDILNLVEYIVDLCRKENARVEDLTQEMVQYLRLEGGDFSPRRFAERVLFFFRSRLRPDIERAQLVWKKGLEKLDRPRDIWLPLEKVFESSALESALECANSRKPDAVAWLDEKRRSIEELRETCFGLYQGTLNKRV